MTTHRPKPIRHVYKEVNVGKFSSVRHFELISVHNGKNQLSKLINLSKDRKCSRASPVYWLKLREGNRWGGWLTGLFSKKKGLVYYGDTDQKRNLLIFRFSEDKRSLVIDYYKNYYTNNLSRILLDKEE